MKLEYRKGLLYTTIGLKWQEKSVIIKDVIVDTGASHTIISTEYLETMDIPLSDNDELVKASGYGGISYYSIRKNIDEIKCGNLILKDMKVDFGMIDPYDTINGLIGLDFLIGTNTIIDLVDLILYNKEDI